MLSNNLIDKFQKLLMKVNNIVDFLHFEFDIYSEFGDIGYWGDMNHIELGGDEFLYKSCHKFTYHLYRNCNAVDFDKFLEKYNIDFDDIKLEYWYFKYVI